MVIGVKEMMRVEEWKNEIIGEDILIVEEREEEGRIENVFIKRMKKKKSFNDVGMEIGEMSKRKDEIKKEMIVEMKKKLKKIIKRMWIEELNNIKKFKCSIKMEKGKRRRGGIERINRKMKNEGGIIEERIENKRIGECRRKIKEKIDGLWLKEMKMSKVFNKGWMMKGI